jgi:hypothetical protein
MNAPGLLVPRRREAGFTFVEVMIALSILLVGSIAILGLFAVGVTHLVDRELLARVEKVRPEVRVILQAMVDAAPSGVTPPTRPVSDPIPLSERNLALAVSWRPAPGTSTSFQAQAVILLQGAPVHTLPPMAFTPSVWKPPAAPDPDRRGSSR